MPLLTPGREHSRRRKKSRRSWRRREKLLRLRSEAKRNLKSLLSNPEDLLMRKPQNKPLPQQSNKQWLNPTLELMTLRPREKRSFQPSSTKFWLSKRERKLRRLPNRLRMTNDP